MKELLIILLVGGFGGLAGAWLKIPGGTLVGAMFAVILFKALGHGDYNVPKIYIFLVQVMVGVMVGAGYTPELGGMVLQIIKPVFLSTLVLVAAGLAMGLLFSRILPMDPVTGYLATSPGAMSSLVAMAAESKAQPTIVAAFHFFRLIFILLTAPLLLKLVQILATRNGG